MPMKMKISSRNKVAGRRNSHQARQASDIPSKHDMETKITFGSSSPEPHPDKMEKLEVVKQTPPKRKKRVVQENTEPGVGVPDVSSAHKYASFSAAKKSKTCNNVSMKPTNASPLPEDVFASTPKGSSRRMSLCNEDYGNSNEVPTKKAK
jgi:hypothetical protein